MGTIVAIDGYQYESLSDEIIKTPIEIDAQILDLSNKKNPKVLFIPTASGDKKTYISSIKKIYQDQLGAEFDTLLLHSLLPNHLEIQNKINWADVIYVGGGNTLMMMKKWRKLSVDTLLKKAYADGKILCGVSAGSICWFEHGISDSLHFYDEESTKYIKVSGLGILAGINCPHFGSQLWDKGYRTAYMKVIMKKERGYCVAIPDGSAVIITDNEYASIGLYKAKKCYWMKEEWKEDEI